MKIQVVSFLNFFPNIFVKINRIIFFISILLSSHSLVFSQDNLPTNNDVGPIISKRGYPILPESGDWSLSIGASGAVRYFGNLFSNAGNNANANLFNYPFENEQLEQTILVRKFLDANTAYRGIVGVNFNTNTQKNMVSSDLGNINEEVKDTRTNSFSKINLGLGLEKRRGVSRLQGVYGAQAIIGFGRKGQSFKYGNDFSASNTTPTSTINFETDSSQSNATSRLIRKKEGLTVYFALQAFGGIEYFFAPKISIGGEFTWGPSISITGKGKESRESWEAGAIKTTTTEEAGASDIGLGFGNAFGSLRLNFYF